MRLILCIGAMKAGTTWLSNQLLGHPQVLSFPIKEWNLLNEWDQMGETTPAIRAIHSASAGSLWGEYWRNQVQTVSYSLPLLAKSVPLDSVGILFELLTKFITRNGAIDFLSRLRAQPGGRHCVDATPEYALVSISTIKRFWDVAPDATILYLLRDPLLRLISHIRMAPEYAPQGQVSTTGARQAARRLDILQHCLYARHARKWQGVVGAKLHLLEVGQTDDEQAITWKKALDACGLEPATLVEGIHDNPTPDFDDRQVIEELFPELKALLLGSAVDVFPQTEAGRIWQSRLEESNTFENYLRWRAN